MGDLRENFSKSEFACHHCGVYKHMNPRLLDGMQKLRDKLGVPITVNSGYRCKNHPIEKSKPNPGQHAQGNAADIFVPNMTQRQLLIYVLQIPEFANGGIGIYPDLGIIHVDTRGYKARWSFIKGTQRSFEDGLKLLK